MKNLYEILGLKPGAQEDEIKRAYYLMAKNYHPDSGDKADVKKFYEVTEAYQILSDPGKKRTYDLTLKTGSPRWRSGAAGKIEKEWLGPREAETVTSYGRSTHEQDPAFRQREVTHYRRQMFIRAILQVILITLACAMLGVLLSILLEGSSILGAIAGFAFGFVWAVNHHFDVSSFMPNHTHLKLIQWGSRVIEALSLLYFAVLFFYHLLRAL